MITPTESLVFSMHANPGVYAVLAGSGVSRAAKIPTGWEITLSLVNQLAHVRQLTCEPGPEEWYRNTFGKEPDYSELLDALTGTPTERQALLRDYIEPSADERDERAKQPTARKAADCSAPSYRGASRERHDSRHPHDELRPPDPDGARRGRRHTNGTEHPGSAPGRTAVDSRRVLGNQVARRLSRHPDQEHPGRAGLL